MQPRIVPEEPTQKIFPKPKSIYFWVLGIVVFLLSVILYCVPTYRYYYEPEELPFYIISKTYQDDTLRIALIGDSWADYHTLLSGDTIIANAAKQIFKKPVKAVTRGKKGALSKEVFFFMYSDKTEEHADEPDRCTQPLIEDHPDYCVIFAGINDVTYLRTLSFYTENMKLIIRLLLHNHIRPVIMEIPLVNFTEPMHRKRLRERLFYRFRSVIMGTSNQQGEDYQKALYEMLSETGLLDSVLYIPTRKWNPNGATDTSMFLTDYLHLNLNGYHRLDSCIISEIVNDYTTRQ
ncbi:MAG: SGNH/GDSL hydrolase family protein [Prevotella sp.]|nr:SGNH/GDSL hydrolase family protein [Prevotella sp.]